MQADTLEAPQYGRGHMEDFADMADAIFLNGHHQLAAGYAGGLNADRTWPEGPGRGSGQREDDAKGQQAAPHFATPGF